MADDAPLFLNLLRDFFPKIKHAPKKSYDAVEAGSRLFVERYRLVDQDTWMLKVIQLYETSLVRHGFMMVGPTLCGKTAIMDTLTDCLTQDPVQPSPHRLVKMIPNAITDRQMYGVKDVVSVEWTPVVFASTWQ